jgi:peptidoglycan/LPS O-acetylase OafA/YrhL
LVIFFHAGLSFVGGGYVGVDVFFVISGFVITGVLLRERSSRDKTSIVGFYGRRCRRILPAASLVIIATIALSYAWVGALSGYRTATDGRWAAIFLVNFHFAAEGTNYLASQQLASPLQNFWSLSVEEQFYLVYPALFMVLAALRTRVTLSARLALGLVLVILCSFALSVVQTTSNPTVAFFSPFTRAWELALGGLVAVGSRWITRIPVRAAAAMTWLGLGAIVAAAVSFNSQTTYPGALVAIPVVGAAMIVAGGVVTPPPHGVESLLRLAPFGWLGDRSYSLYLWHWPILIVAAESQGKASLPFLQNVPLLAPTLFVSVASYALVENPIRHSRLLSRTRWASIALGVGLMALTVVVATVVLRSEPTVVAAASSRDKVTPGTDAEVSKLVAASTQIQRLPAGLSPSLGAVDFGWPPFSCSPAADAVTESPSCVFGDPLGSHSMVLYGDSHALMWFEAVDEIAIRAHWRLFILGHDYCKADTYPPGSSASDDAIIRTCSRWQRFAEHRIRQIAPNLVIVTQEYKSPATPAQWQQGLKETLEAIAGPSTRLVVLGNIPIVNVSPPDCLAEHPDAVQTCSGSPLSDWSDNRAEQRAVRAVGGRYISVTPWFCSTTCSAVIGRYQVYSDRLHVNATYTLYLRRVLAEQLQLARL